MGGTKTGKKIIFVKGKGKDKIKNRKGKKIFKKKGGGGGGQEREVSPSVCGSIDSHRPLSAKAVPAVVGTRVAPFQRHAPLSLHCACWPCDANRGGLFHHWSMVGAVTRVCVAVES